MFIRCEDRPRERRGRSRCCRGVTNLADIDLSRKVAEELELGMRVILRGELTVSDSEASIDSPEVRLVSWKLYLPPAQLKGQLVEVDEDTGGWQGKLKSADRIVRVKLRRKVRLIGDPRWQRSFQQQHLLGLKLGMELEVRGYWCPWAGPLDAQGRTKPDLIFVEQIRIVKNG